MFYHPTNPTALESALGVYNGSDLHQRAVKLGWLKADRKRGSAVLENEPGAIGKAAWIQKFNKKREPARFVCFIGGSIRSDPVGFAFCSFSCPA